MSRRHKAEKREVLPDPKFGDAVLSRFMNVLMYDGKKSTAERIVYDALAIIGERSGKEPVEALETSIKALTPVLEVRSRRVGGATYQVPVEVRAERAQALYDADVIAAAEVQRRASEYQISVAETRAAADQLHILGVSPAAVERLGKDGAVDSVTPVVATLAGVVVERKLAQGQVVQPADTLFVVADLSRLAT